VFASMEPTWSRSRASRPKYARSRPLTSARMRQGAEIRLYEAH
jgi:hypothetical protein